MDKHKIKKIIITSGLSIILIIGNITPVFARGGDQGSITNATYDANTGNNPNTTNNTNGNNSTTGTTKGGTVKNVTKTVYTPPSDLQAVDWNKVKIYLSSIKNNLKSDTKAGNATTAYYVMVRRGTSYTKRVKDVDANGDITFTTITYYSPSVIVDFRFNGEVKDIRKEYATPYYNWRKVSGPEGGLAKDSWTTSGITSKVSYFKVGDYTISSVPHQTWNTYTRDTFTAFVMDYYNGGGKKELTSKLYSYDTFVKKSEGDDTGNLKKYNMKIATQDLNQQVEVHDVTTSIKYDAVPKLIE